MENKSFIIFFDFKPDTKISFQNPIDRIEHKTVKSKDDNNTFDGLRCTFYCCNAIK